ncbi:LysR family transcriptional regulator [Sphaerisporangium corydalis]|uniref:LysR family transcriptional regulator n=1 Tax=Sphaerisporangium corydalis TaxID=1441875 RepID=A0ABV9ENJ9_9ACTN|nr:LysR family transcriptional regulator [Sphaerisporangium corydalis]
MERQEIEVFLVLAEELHFARTAERLRVSAATISQTIAKLERLFGAPLFHRTTRRVELTPLGRQLLDDLRPAHAGPGRDRTGDRSGA